MGVFSKKKVALDLQAISTLISEGATVDGDLKAPAFTRIDGKVTGNVHVDEGLILGEKGTIQGNVITKQVIVYGIVHGNISVQSLEIKATGKITGDIETATLQVEAGGVYNGKLAMTSADTKHK
ncbi:MAG TPA: polymer-forming cytoskeletal protein [Mucilaginibacter sp.]|jgi:cytoskeletal protein CcmA (bactofilin family)|nr:polymer-forming cytoskeletal protein [Mucilaginibacter sp.]